MKTGIVSRLVVALMLSLLVVTANCYLVPVSSIANVGEFQFEVSGHGVGDAPATWIDDYLWHQGAPYKYRILGKLPLWAVYQVQLASGTEPKTAFYHAFVICCFASLFLVLVMLGLFTRTLITTVSGVLPRASLMGLECAAMLLFTSAPPVLLFAKFANHGSPNDFIGYFLMLAALHLAWLNRLAMSCAVAIIAVFCRETTLLIPFALLFFRIPLRKKLGLAVLPATALAVYHLLWPDSYDQTAGARLNFQLPLQTLAFAFLTFGPLWILGLAGYLDLRRRDRVSLPSPLLGLLASFPAAALLTSGVVLFLARVREMRILFVLSLYLIPFSILMLYNRRAQILGLLKNVYFTVWALVALTITFRIRVWLLPVDASSNLRLQSALGTMFTTSLDGGQSYWIVINAAYLFLFLACVPIALLTWHRPPPVDAAA